MDSFTLETPQFQGPLEALLDLIEARKLSVSQVSLAEVCDAYLAYIERLPELPVAETSQFILVASTLLLIKSRSLLPTIEVSDEEEESIQELERRLAQLRVYRDAAKLLRKEWGRKPYFLERRAPARLTVFAPADTSLSVIQAAAHRLLASIPSPEKLGQAVVAPVLRLEEVIGSLKERLGRGLRTRWSELSRNLSRHDAIVQFLAILELVRHGHASVTQDKLFSDISIEGDGGEESVPRFGF